VAPQVFQTPNRLTLDIRLPSGTIDIEGSETTETEVELVPMNDPARETIDAVRIELRDRHDDHQLLVESPERKGFGLFGRSPEFRLTIRCPHGANLEVRSRSADVYGRGRFGTADIKTASGDTMLDRVEGRANIAGASGDVEIRAAAGPVDINSASGDVLIERAEESVRVNVISGDVAIREAVAAVSVNSVSGDQIAEIGGGGSVSLQSVSGDIDVSVRRGINVFMDVRTISGDTHSELELGEEPPPDDAPMVELRLKSVSGDVNIRRAAAAVESVPDETAG
jgi:hypothetical protein